MELNERLFLLPECGNLYKANLHCHSTVSDGKFTPEELKKMYMERGYHAVAYTDHQLCLPHTELTDENFVALTGLEIAFGIRRGTSVHICGIARNPDASLKIPNETEDDIEKINEGIARLNREGYITTLNHPRWSGMSAEALASIGEVASIEVLNGYELIQDGYGDSSACYELELRRGRRVSPIATDDSHTRCEGGAPGHEYFRGFTVLKAAELTYDSLINALDSGAFYASTGPTFKNLWIENGVLHVECSAVSGVYVHGSLYSHLAAVIDGENSIEVADIPIADRFESSDYLFVQIADKDGRRAWSAPFFLR